MLLSRPPLPTIVPGPETPWCTRGFRGSSPGALFPRQAGPRGSLCPLAREEGVGAHTAGRAGPGAPGPGARWVVTSATAGAASAATPTLVPNPAPVLTARGCSARRAQRPPPRPRAREVPQALASAAPLPRLPNAAERAAALRFSPGAANKLVSPAFPPRLPTLSQLEAAPL